MRAVKCPACGKQGDWFGGGYGPFCSRRCKLIDLGKWFGEEHTISAPLTAADLDALNETETGTDRTAREDPDRQE